MTINSTNNTNDVEILPSKKIKKPKGDFSTFFKNLGKTDKPKKDSATNIVNKNMEKNPDNKLISNLLDNKVINNKPNPSINKATQIPNKQNAKFQNIAFEEQNKLPNNNQIKDIPQNKTKADILNNLLQNKTIVEDKNNKPINYTKDSIKKVAFENTPSNINPANQNDIKNDIKNNVAENLSKQDSSKNSTILDSTLSKNTAQKAIIPNQDLLKTTDSTLNPNDNSNDEKINDKNEDSTNKEILSKQDSPILPQNTSQFSMLNDDEIKLPIKDILKYGAFKSFDALSLLKPSDGKKLSDLIKKADELALNLTKIKMQNDKAKVPLNDKITENLDLKNSNLKNQINDIKNNEVKENTSKDLGEIKPQNENKVDTPKNEPNNQTKDVLKDALNNKDSKDSNVLNNKDSKDSKQDSPQKQAQNNQTKVESPKESTQNPQNIQNPPNMQEEIKPVAFKQNEKKEVKNSEETKSNNNNEKTLDSANNIKNEQLQKTYDIKETIRSFATQLKQEIINYKPPLSKITLELNPANLGSVEVSITHQGKNIQLQLNANQNTINMFIQNQSDLRAALSQIGYENITMSFSNGSQMGFSDSKGNWNYQNITKAIDSNINDDSSDEMASMDITIVNNYA
ncbi:hypothetical protein CCY99_08815 [Helicobacter sp. 16-1353]|uniref:flagellar hook-length control protein FliK n=1 Tax=Helicobacter sp. 16-1353 TaxID=2004996 RepID=UPI000DCCEC13|nr:flagellar hook-length control protein FliK [Helicobacter sp. 16-1353]RAX51553.1 hypothetical protein CCY99_08815 [Helicobacter sp. 16-1353]